MRLHSTLHLRLFPRRAPADFHGGGACPRELWIDERHVELGPESTNRVHKLMRLDLPKHILDIDGVAVGALIGELRDMARA